MELISLNDAASRIEDIDELVSVGEFSSRAEAYRTGGLLMVLRPKVRELAKKTQLDPIVFGKHIKNCIDAIQNKDLDKVNDELQFVVDGLIFRELLSTVLSKENERLAFENIREGLTLSRKTLSKITEMDEETKKDFLLDLDDDLGLLQDYVEENLKSQTEVRVHSTLTGLLHTAHAYVFEVAASGLSGSQQSSGGTSWVIPTNNIVFVGNPSQVNWNTTDITVTDAASEHSIVRLTHSRKKLARSKEI